MQSADAYSKSGLDNGHGNFGSWTPSGMVAGVPEPVVYQQQQNQAGPELFYGRWQGWSRTQRQVLSADICKRLQPTLNMPSSSESAQLLNASHRPTTP